MFVLDTDVLSIIEWAASSAAAQQLSERIAELKDEVVTTIISLEEQMRGWMALLRSKKSVKEEVEVYRRLRRQFHNLCKLKLLEFDEHCAIKFQELKKSKLKVGTMDLKVGSIVLVNNATIITGNTVDYETIPGLQVKDWRKL
jgi:tRNA(fMet)-specific endonuclease VapC